MARLLQKRDFSFLAAQPGFSPQLGRRFRSKRRQVFRGYLRTMRRDFGQAALVCWTLMIRATEDRHDLAKVLIRQHLMFTLGVFAVEGICCSMPLGWARWMWAAYSHRWKLWKPGCA